MSVLNQSGEEQVECPLCMEPLEVDDLHFYPCTCGYQICRFCWNRIREGENGLCPACRKAYPENPADFTPLSQEQVAAIKTEKKAREQKRRNKTLESRKALANVRVVQNNLVFVVGLPVRLADPEILKRQEYFGKYGKIHKVVINQSTTYAGTQGPSASAYVTYVSSADALRAIQGVNNVTLDGRVLKGSLGTTKYCANFMKNQPCPKPDCMYLHELGDPKASFTKEEMHAGLHQVYERKLHNQLLAQQRDASYNGSGNSSTNAEKGSTKDGNPSNFIPSTVVTSSHINNVVNSSKSNKKDSVNGTTSTSSSSSTSSTTGSKDAWPSLGGSPPAPASPAPDLGNGKPLENGTSESSSPTLVQPTATKSKDRDDHTHGKHRNESQPNKRSKSDKKKHSNNVNSEHSEPTHHHQQQQQQNQQQESPNTFIQQQQQQNQQQQHIPNNTHSSVFNSDTQYLSNELDELESDRHSLLENHDLLNSSDHSLLEDDSTHNLLNDANNEALLLQRHRDMIAGLVDSQNHMIRKNMTNGFYDRDMAYERQLSQGIMEKELALRERSRSEMLMRHNEMLARQHGLEHKHYMPGTSIGLEAASELLGNNFHPNPNMVPFGMRVDNAMSNNSMNNSINSMAGPLMGMNKMPNSMNYMMHQQMINQQAPNPNQMVNGFDAQQNIQNEGRYLAENMDKFFTDFHKAQQMRLLLGNHSQSHSNSQSHNHNLSRQQQQQAQYGQQHLAQAHAQAQAMLQRDHKQRMSGLVEGGAAGARCAGDGDDDLDFDPFKETQKALAEMMETEMMQGAVSGGDSAGLGRRGRLPPPGFGLAPRLQPQGIPAPQHNHPHGFGGPQSQGQGQSQRSPMFADWTQMDPAIVSTSHQQPQPKAPVLSPQQHELFARFNQLNVNGMKAPQWGSVPWGQSYAAIPLPPGFAPPKPGSRPAECIESK